jgi:hypothetical protein
MDSKSTAKEYAQIVELAERLIRYRNLTKERLLEKIDARNHGSRDSTESVSEGTLGRFLAGVYIRPEKLYAIFDALIEPPEEERLCFLQTFLRDLHAAVDKAPEPVQKIVCEALATDPGGPGSGRSGPRRRPRCLGQQPDGSGFSGPPGPSRA